MNAKSYNEWTALMFAAYFGNSDITDMLIKAEADIHIKDKNEQTVLDITKMFNRTKVVKVFKQTQ